MTNKWNSFVKKFSNAFPSLRGPNLMKEASPIYKKCKNAREISFWDNAILADGVYIPVIFDHNNPNLLEVGNTNTPPSTTDAMSSTTFVNRTRGPTAYNIFVTSHKVDKRHDACKQWKTLHPNQKRMYQKIVEDNEWKAFYNLMNITKNEPSELLAEFFSLPKSLKSAMNE